MPNERVLVAEDERDLRRMCLRALEMAGYVAVGACDGHEAVSLAREQHFDVLVTDVKMPQLDGLDAFREIRAFRPDLTSVVMTGFGTLDTAIEAIRLGVYEFVLKPFRPEELTNAIERALTRRRLEQENARLKALLPLFDLGGVFMSSADLDTVPRHVVRIARAESRADCATLMLLDEDGMLKIHSAEGCGVEKRGHGPRLGEGTAGRAVATRRSIHITGDLSNDPWAAEEFGSAHVCSAVSVPFGQHDKVLGVLNVARIREEEPFRQVDVDFLSLLGSQAAVAIENARLFREIQEAYEHLAELDHLKSEFLNIAAHELRSPLAVVLAYATLLEDEATGPMRQHLGQVVQAAMQLKSIIDEMVSLQHIDTGQAPVQIEDLELSPVVAEVLDDLRLLIDQKELALQVDIPRDLPWVRADRQLLHLILGALVSNAAKFTPEGGRITVGACVVDERVMVQVRDTGIGIPTEELERVFGRFYQVEDSLRRKHGGIGLGLAMAREMGRLISAEITVASNEGEGSTFFVSLPAAPAATLH